MPRVLHTALLAVAIAIGATTAGATASETLWTTNPDLPTFFSSSVIGPSVLTPISNKELADDFNVIGVIEKVLADGKDCQGCFSGQPVTGVFVRFYQWTAAGPGALQSEEFIPNGSPNFIWTPGSGPEYLQITLTEPFQATGWHFISVQVAFSAENAGTGKWNFVPVNWNAPMGISAHYRNVGAGGAWTPYNQIDGFSPRDASFALIGVPGGPTPMVILSATSHPITPSCRLRINGDGFGANQGSGRVLVDDVPAIVTQWTDTVIIAYAPEQTGIGEATLKVVNHHSEESTHVIDVQPREVDGRVQWRFAIDADFTNHRPGIAPDGSIYVNDYNRGRLYKLSADGGLHWIVDALRGQIGLGGSGPVNVGDDGTVYVAVNPLGPTVDMLAFNPDGTLKWEFIEPNALGVAVGPAIGPDGNIYVAFHHINPVHSGLVSFTPDGEVRWNNVGSPPLYEHGGLGAELVFGASEVGGPVDQAVLTVDRDGDPFLYAFDMESGAQRWAVPRGVTQDVFLQPQIQPEAGADGKVYMTDFVAAGLGWALWAFDGATGERLWHFDPNILAGASGPELGPDGNIYFSWDISRVSKVSPNGEHIWTHVDFNGVRTLPTATEDNKVVMVGGGNFGESGSFKAIDAATGDELWKIQLPDEDGNIVPDERPIVTEDSSTSYWPTVILADGAQFQYCYLYAVTVGEPSVLGDLNGDGIVDGADLGLLLTSWGRCAQCADCPADLNGDCTVDGADLGILLNNWS